MTGIGGVAGGPQLAAVVGLLYRADWTRLSLSGEVRGDEGSWARALWAAGRASG